MPTTTERCSIGKAETGRAERMARDGFDGIYIFKHMGREGLQLRVQKHTAAWIVRYKDFTVTIGYLWPERNEAPIPGHVKGLDLASDVKAVLMGDEAGRVKEYLRHRHGGLKHHDALAALRPNANTWLFGECIDRMLEDREDPTSKHYLKPGSVKDVRTTFNRPSLEKLKATPASLLTRSEFEAARDTIRKEAGTSPAQKFVAWSRGVFSYMAGVHSGPSGIDGRDRWWELLHATHAVKAKDRNPEVEDIVRSLVIAEDYLAQPLPGRSISAPGVGAGVLAGLWWIVMTCQRADAALSLKTYNLLPDGTREGWFIAAWEDAVMKAGQAQLLPIPPRAAAHIESIRLRATNHGSQQWAFPSDRDPDKHATLSGVYRVLYRLAGRDALVQERPEGWQPRMTKAGVPKKLPERTERRDLLAEAGVAWWSLHDVRRRIQVVLDLAGIPGGSSVILAHEMKTSVDLNLSMTQQQREDLMRQRQARITAQAYGGAHFLKLKGEAMEIWADALLDEYDRQKAARAAPPEA